MTNLLSLESFRREFSLHPWHFWQCAGSTLYPVSSDCNDVVYQQAWQSVDSAARDNIRTAIESAESRLREYLRYSIAPHYVVETQPVPRYYDINLLRTRYVGADGRWLTVQLREGKIRKVGPETRTLIGTVNLTYSDMDGDGLNDAFVTAALATTVTDVTEIEVMIAAADRWDGSAADDRWVVKPVTVVISGGSVTVRGRAWQVVKPVRYESNAIVDPTVGANFVTTLEVYRHYANTAGTTTDTAQAVLTWETRPWPWFASICCNNNANPNEGDPASYATAIARVNIRDAEAGIVSFGEAVYDTTNAQWFAVTGALNCRPPDRIEIRYQAGDAPDTQGNVSQKWQTIAARFGAAELNKRVCACEAANRLVYEQQIDRAFAGDARVEKFTLSQNDLDSPFGTREGALYAWRNVRNLRQLVGVIA